MMRICHVEGLLPRAAVVACAAVAVVLSARVTAGESGGAEPRREIFTGAILAGNSWIGWAGGVTSFSGSLYESGFRLRAAGCYGSYDYNMDGEPNRASPALVEVTPGYMLRKGPLFAKLFFGLHAEQHTLARPDPDNAAAEAGIGAKLLSENWLNLPYNSFASLDASYSTRHAAYQGMLRLGSAYYLPHVQLGGEAGIIGNEDSRQFRFGGLVRYALGSYSMEGSGGYALDYDNSSTPYFGLSLSHKF